MKKPVLNAILIPGFLSGLIIWGVQFAGDNFLISAGITGMRSTLFPITVFIITPVLLVITGMISEKIHIRETGGYGTPRIPFLAGFLGMSIAIFLFLFGAYMDQYVPSMEPGLLPRLSFTVGIILVLLPLQLLVSAVFAFFSLAGGYYLNRIQKQGNGI